MRLRRIHNIIAGVWLAIIVYAFSLSFFAYAADNPQPQAAGPGQQRQYTEPGINTFDPQTPLRSIGTFGSFGKGTAVQNPDSEGLLTFNIKRDAPAQAFFWPRILPGGKDLVLGSFRLPGKRPRVPLLKVIDWVTAGMDVRTQGESGDMVSNVLISRCIPAVRYDVAGPEWTWESNSKEVAFDRAAYRRNGGDIAVVKFGSGSSNSSDGDILLPGDDLTAPWLILWNSTEGDIGVVPMLIRLQHRPESIVISRLKNGRSNIKANYKSPAGCVSVMPLYGIRRIRGSEANDWAEDSPTGSIHKAASEAETWSRILAAFPSGTEESFSLDLERRTVEIKDKFTYQEIRDDWGTVPLHIAPLPPVAVLAKDAGYPVEWSDGQVVVSEVSTYFGPFAYNTGSQVIYNLPIPQELDQMPVPVEIKGDKSLQRIQDFYLNYLVDYSPAFPRPDDTAWNGDAVKAMSFAHMLLPKDIRPIMAATARDLFRSTFDPANLQTVTDPTLDQKYVTSSKVWVAQEPFDKEWYNGRQLDWAWNYTYFMNPNIPDDYWKSIKGLYAYFRIYNDWAWSGSLSSVFGYTSLADGMNFAYEGILGTARLAKIVGDDEVWRDAVYRAAKQSLSVYNIFSMPMWVKKMDYAILHWSGTRQSPEDVLQGFGVDGYFEATGVETQEAKSFWESTNYLYWNNPAELRLYSTYLYRQMYDWEYKQMPALHPNWFDGTADNAVDKRSYGGEWAAAHIIARSLLFGEESEHLYKYLITSMSGSGSGQFNTYVPVLQAILQANAPQVWAPVTFGRVVENNWDASQRRLTTTITYTCEGKAAYQWTWRSGSWNRVSQGPNPGPKPVSVQVDGQKVPYISVDGGYWQVSLNARKGRKATVVVDYGQP